MTKTVVHPSSVASFLAGHRFAIAGASSAKGSLAPAIADALRERGYEVVAVHPTNPTFQDGPCYPDLAAVPGDLDGVIVLVHRDRAADVVRASAARGVPKVWLFQGIGGAGAVSDEALAAAAEHGLEVVPGACPLMFLEPVGLPHRVHRGLRRVNRSLARAG